jgi:hypothetical protein
VQGNPRLRARRVDDDGRRQAPEVRWHRLEVGDDGFLQSGGEPVPLVVPGGHESPTRRLELGGLRDQLLHPVGELCLQPRVAQGHGGLLREVVGKLPLVGRERSLDVQPDLGDQVVAVADIDDDLVD